MAWRHLIPSLRCTEPNQSTVPPTYKMNTDTPQDSPLLHIYQAKAETKNTSLQVQCPGRETAHYAEMNILNLMQLCTTDLH